MSDTIRRTRTGDIKGMFEGPVLSVLVRLALPILAGMLFQLLYTIVDTLMVSRIDLNDPSYVGGVGLVFPIVFFAIAIGTGLQVGISSDDCFLPFRQGHYRSPGRDGGLLHARR